MHLHDLKANGLKVSKPQFCFHRAFNRFSFYKNGQRFQLERQKSRERERKCLSCSISKVSQRQPEKKSERVIQDFAEERSAGDFSNEKFEYLCVQKYKNMQVFVCLYGLSTVCVTTM